MTRSAVWAPLVYSTVYKNIFAEITYAFCIDFNFNIISTLPHNIEL